jgi:hypothetical protein
MYVSKPAASCSRTADVSSYSGILIRLEPNKDASLARLTIRSTNDMVSAEILEVVAKPLNKDTMAPAT